LRVLASLHKTSLNHQAHESSRRAHPAIISAVSQGVVPGCSAAEADSPGEINATP
jgi:hypothetical protein